MLLRKKGDNITKYRYRNLFDNLKVIETALIKGVG